MNDEREERRLAAILSADAVGYSRLMAEDEAATVRAITAYRQEIALLVEQSRGRVVDATGDNLLAEFATASGAVRCALEIQRVLGARNALLPRDRRLEFRIGVHLGEVRVEDGRVYGDGVNIAARIEALAEPGGVCVSMAVRDQARVQSELAFDDLGERSLKNIAEPVHVYRVRGEPPGEAVPSPQREVRPRRRVTIAFAVLAIAAGLAAAGWWARSALTGGGGDPPADFTVSGFGDRPAIAVLPFENLSQDPEQEYFADGLAEDLITRLSLWRLFPVIARNSSFTYKGSAVDLKRVSAELGVRYVVEGSVRRAGERVRISAQLIDATTGQHVWAETYDRDVSNVFALQDEISTAIASSLVGDLSRAEATRALQREPQSLDAWGLYQRATSRYLSLTREANAEARDLLKRAIALDPQFASAWARLAQTYYVDGFMGWADAPEQSNQEALRAARKAVELDPGNPLAQMALSMVFLQAGERESSARAARRAVELNPSMPGALNALGFAQSYLEGSDAGIETLQRALRLAPRDPFAWAFWDDLSGAYFLAGRYAEGLDAAQRVIEMRPDYSWGYLDLAMNQVGLGRLDEARATMRTVRRQDPGLTLEAVRRTGLSPEIVERLSAPLREAGLE